MRDSRSPLRQFAENMFDVALIFGAAWAFLKLVLHPLLKLVNDLVFPS